MIDGDSTSRLVRALDAFVPERTWEDRLQLLELMHALLVAEARREPQRSEATQGRILQLELRRRSGAEL